MERSLVGLIDDDHTENTQMGVRKHILCGWMNLLTHVSGNTPSRVQCPHIFQQIYNEE